MAWIESHQSLGTHRKLLALCQALHIDDTRAVGMLHYLWWWALDNAPDGDISGVSDKTLAVASHWKGSPTLWVQTLREVGLVDAFPPQGGTTMFNREVGPGGDLSGQQFLHDWSDYAGKLIAQRNFTKEEKRQGGINRMSKLSPEDRKCLAEKAAHARWDASTSRHDAGIADASSMPADASRMPATVPNRTLPNHTVPKKESIKEMQGQLALKERFDIFWKTYPRKMSKGQAEKAFLKVNPDEQLLATMLATIERATKSVKWLEKDGEFIPYPATWINAKGWEDEYPERRVKSGPHQGNPSQKPAGAFDDLDTDQP